MKLKFLTPLLLAAAALGFSSCSSDDGGGSNTTMYLDIVTLKSSDPAGTVLTMRANGDSPLVTYTTTQPIKNENIKIGDRIIINYTAENGRLENGPIKIYASALTIGQGRAIPQKDATEAGEWYTETVNMNDIWRTGQYLNIVFTAYSAPTPAKCELILDKNTLDAEYPVAHLVFKSSEGADVNTYAFYMSYSLPTDTECPNMKGITIEYKDNNGVPVSKQIEYTFGSTIRPVE